jgi:FAD/FMN-containing dehydrogenase
MTFDELRSSLAGTVIGPEDAEYDAARICFNALVDRRPAVIAQCLGPADVGTSFDFARVHGLEVAVRGGGHNPAGHCVLDGGLVIDLSRMRSVDVDGAAQIARAEGGSTWLDFDTATQRFGLVTPGGVVGSTGVCGLTLGGGIGHLTAQHGLTCDNLIGAELVTPDGSVVRANGDENEELLWGLRGAGGNFGVATRLEFRLQPLESVLGGLLTFRGTGVRDALRRFRDLVAGSPRDLSCQVGVAVDESLTPVLEVAPCYTGPAGDPEELQVLRSSRGVVADRVRRHSLLDQQRVFDSAYGENRHYWKGQFRRRTAGRADRRAAAAASGARPPPGRAPDRVAARCAEGRGCSRRRSPLAARRVQRQRDRNLAGSGPRRAAHRLDARDRGGDRAVVAQQRRLRQLHAGGRADRACACGVWK